MKKEDIAKQIRAWMEEGKLFTRGALGGYYILYRKAAEGEILMTRKPSVFARDKAAADAFNAWVDNGAVMTYNDIAAKHPDIAKRHQLDAACALGRFIKLRVYGALLFIEDEDA